MSFVFPSSTRHHPRYHPPESAVEFSKGSDPMERILKFARRLSAIRGPPAINYAIERVKLCSEARNMVARLNRVIEIAFDERVCRRTNVDLDKVVSRDELQKITLVFRLRELFSRCESVADQSGIHKVARPELPRGEILRLGDRARAKTRTREKRRSLNLKN